MIGLSSSRSFHAKGTARGVLFRAEARDWIANRYVLLAGFTLRG
jgi:hypothetical protein